MSAPVPKLRLGPLPRTESTKLTVNVSAELRASLDDYAAAHSRMHGEPVDPATLIPHMLQAFITRDRGFKALRSSRPSKPDAKVSDDQ